MWPLCRSTTQTLRSCKCNIFSSFLLVAAVSFTLAISIIGHLSVASDLLPESSKSLRLFKYWLFTLWTDQSLCPLFSIWILFSLQIYFSNKRSERRGKKVKFNLIHSCHYEEKRGLGKDIDMNLFNVVSVDFLLPSLITERTLRWQREQKRWRCGVTMRKYS